MSIESSKGNENVTSCKFHYTNHLNKLFSNETHMSTTRSQKQMNRVKRAHEHLELTKLMNNKA